MNFSFGLLFGFIIGFGALYELIRNKTMPYSNNNFIIIYDYNANYLILYLKDQLEKNSQYMINFYTKEFISYKNMGICSISLENIIEGTNIRELSCGHYFKKEFIDNWLLENNNCPLCRSDFRKNI